MVGLIEEDAFDGLLEVCMLQGLACAKAQMGAGAAASIIGPALYEEKVFSWEKKLIDGIKELGEG
jgi:hypothetical protein